MLLIRNGFLSALFSALLSITVFYPGSATAKELKQIKLTEKHIQGVLAADEEMTELRENADSDQPDDPKVEAQAAAVAKKHGFSSLTEYYDAWNNLLLILFSIDPQTKQFAEPPEQIKNEIEGVKTDTSLSEAERNERLTELEDALKMAQPIQFKENIALVLKYYEQLAPLTVTPAE